MTILPAFVALQATRSWHDGGMFMGMHWLWWTFWVATLVVLVWGFIRLFADRSETHRNVRREESAEDELRDRFAHGEIDEEEYMKRLRVLRETYLGV